MTLHGPDHGDPVVEYHRRWGTVKVDPDNKIVRKDYTFPTIESSRFQARQELDRLTRLGEVLDGIPGLRCPRPFSLIDDDVNPPAVEMEWCAGESLHLYLMRASVSTEEARNLAARLASGLIAYVETFQEHYADASFHNALYDAETNQLTLIDFGPWRMEQQAAVIPPLESSLGSVLGSAVRTLAMPSRRHSWRQRWRLLRAAATVVVEAEAQQPLRTLSSEAIRGRAWHTYRSRRHPGRSIVRLWHVTGGAILARLLLRVSRRLAR